MQDVRLITEDNLSPSGHLRNHSLDGIDRRAKMTISLISTRSTYPNYRSAKRDDRINIPRLGAMGRSRSKMEYRDR